MNQQLQTTVTLLRAAPLADHCDITSLMAAFIGRMEEAQRQFPRFDLGAVLDHLSDAEGALEEVYAGEVSA